MLFYIFILSLPIILYFLKKYMNGGINTKTHDLNGQFIIITGASSGIGKESAFDLLKSNARVIFACRNEEKAKKVMKEIPENLKKNAEYLELDLCNFDSIIIFSNKIKKDYPKIDILMNNAGGHPRLNLGLTKDNYDNSFQGNYIGPFLLTILLIPHMNTKGRIINVSSIAHQFVNFDENIINIMDNYEEIKKKYLTGKYSDSLNLYCIEKCFMMYFTSYFKDIFENKNIDLKIVSLHPGSVYTDFVRFGEDYTIVYYGLKIFSPLFWFLCKSPFQGAQTQLFLSYVDYNELINGGYYADCKLTEQGKISKDEKLKQIVINWSIKGLKDRLIDNELVQQLSLI